MSVGAPGRASRRSLAAAVALAVAACGRPYRILGEEVYHLTLRIPLLDHPYGRLDLEVLGRPDAQAGDPYLLAGAQLGVRP